MRYSLRHAGILTAQLPPNARIYQAIEPASAWTWRELLLADAANSLRQLVWMQTEDGAKGRNRPKLFEPPKVEEIKQTENETYDIEDYERLLKGRRTSIEDKEVE